MTAKSVKIYPKENVITKVFLLYDNVKIDITNKIQTLPEITFGLNNTTNIIQANSLIFIADNIDRFFYDAVNKSGVFNNEKNFLIEINITKKEVNNYQLTETTRTVFKGYINNSSITIIDDDVVQFEANDYFEYILEQKLNNRRYNCIYGGRPDIDITKALDSIGVSYQYNYTNTTENWLKNIVSTIEFSGENVECIKDFWQTKTYYINNEYLTGFIIIFNDKIYAGFFNETTKELTINSSFDYKDVSCFIFDAVGKDKVHASYYTNTANCHFYVGTHDINSTFYYDGLTKQDFNGFETLTKNGFFANDSHYYYPNRYPINDISKINVDFDFYNKSINIYQSKRWGFILGYRYFTVSDDRQYVIFPKTISIIEESTNVKFYGTIVSTTFKDVPNQNVNIIAVDSGDNFITLAGYDMNNMGSDYLNQMFSFAPAIAIDSSYAYFIGNKEFPENICSTDAYNNAATLSNAAARKHLNLLMLETLSKTTLKGGSPIGGDILYCGTSGGYDYYLYLIQFLWNINEDGNYNWALYSLKVDTTNKTVAFNYVDEGNGLFVGIRHLSNKDNTNNYPCLYYSNKSGSVNINVYEKIPSGTTPSLLTTFGYYTQSHNAGYWLYSKDVSYSSWQNVFYYFQNYKRSSGTKDKILNTIIYNDSSYNIIRFLSYSEQTYFYPQYNETILFNNIGDLLTNFCVGFSVVAFYDYDENKIYFNNIEDTRDSITLDDDYYTCDIIPYYSRNFKKIKINKNMCSISTGAIDNYGSELNLKTNFNLISSIYSAMNLRKQNCYNKEHKIYKLSGLAIDAKIGDVIGSDKIIALKFNIGNNTTEIKTETGYDNFVYYDFHDYNTFNSLTKSNVSVNANNIDYNRYLYMYGGAYTTASNGYLESSSFDFNYPIGATFKVLGLDINCDDGITFYIRPYNETSYSFSTKVNTNVVNINPASSFDIKIQGSSANSYVYFIRIYGKVL